MADTSLWTDLCSVRRAFVGFAEQCAIDRARYRLTPRADPSSYARCFWVYCQHLADERFPATDQTGLADAIRSSVREMRTTRDPRPQDKPYRQLLAFSLSALAVLDALDRDPLADLVEEQIPADVAFELNGYGSLEGRPGSGNQAMFSAIFLLHARDWLRMDLQARIDDWVDLHLKHMNRFGFWGSDRGFTHLQFQNGYHQYEILEYLGVSNPRGCEAVAAVRGLADPLGHFAPYPGGGGCYDYDAVFLLTPNGRLPDAETRPLLERTAATLMSEQGWDGGFAESLYVRPRLSNIWRFAVHIARSVRQPRVFLERLRYAITLQRATHNRVHTHWSRYSRGWSESDLWDSWFRMLTLARIQVALDPEKAAGWGFIDYPGIGHHPILRARPPRA